MYDFQEHKELEGECIQYHSGLKLGCIITFKLQFANFPVIKSADGSYSKVGKQSIKDSIINHFNNKDVHNIVTLRFLKEYQ